MSDALCSADDVRAVRARGYAPIHGLAMYHEVAGEGPSLVYIPPHLGVTGVNGVPALACHHTVITIDLQGHGRTADLPERPMSLEQNADDVIALLEHLGIARASFLGESYGGATALLVALRRPDLVDRVATYGATFGPPAEAHNLEMLRFDAPPGPDSACFAFQRQSYERVAPDPAYWPRFWRRGGEIQWNGFTRAELASITAPVLIALGDRDFVRVEHAVEAFRALPRAELAVIPDAGHFALSSEPERVLPVVERFLEARACPLPVATAGMGYRPGETR